jgi:hypothetical protein
MQLPGWKADIVISDKETTVTTKATSAVTQQLVQDKLEINKEQCHEQLVISTPVLQDELLVESPFIRNRTKTVELGLKQPVWKNYARRYTDKSPTLAKLSNSIRSSNAEQECELLAIANRAFVIANRAFEESKQKKTSRPQHKKKQTSKKDKQRLWSNPTPQSMPKIKTAAELCEEEFLEKLRKQCALLPQNNLRIQQSGVVGVNVLKTRMVDSKLAKQLDEVTSGQRGLELCLLQNELHHSLSDILLILHDGTKLSSEVFSIVKQHQHLLLPAICVLYDKGRDDKAEFEQLISSGKHLMVIDHPATELAPKFLVKATGSSTYHRRVLALIFF